MKKLFIAIGALLLSATFVNAQTGDPELDYIKKTYSKEKKDLVGDYMSLSGDEASKFWPVYNAFEAGREKLANQRVKLIQDYIKNAGNLTPALADKLAMGALANNTSLDKLNADYYVKMKAAIGSVKAAKCIQLEAYLQTTWRSVIQDKIPMIGELEKSH